MIQDVAGDILLTGAQVIAHGIATHDHFDTGLALSLRERFPSMVRDYRHAIHGKPLDVGAIWAWKGVDEAGQTRGVVNLLTQGMVGSGPAARPGKATLDNVAHALKALARYVQAEGVTSVALPRVATGVGGLQWDEVKPLMQAHLGALNVPVFVYHVYHKDHKAYEKLA
jgi:O-acetyl-ADP-ribose deacetylase (regulator of RNase III)